MKKLRHVLFSIRPSACVMVSVFALAAYRPDSSEWTLAILLAVCSFFGSAFCFLVNDIYDRKKDILNNKLRPIATGELPVGHARFWAFAFALIYVATSFAFGWIIFGLALFSIFLFLPLNDLSDLNT